MMFSKSKIKIIIIIIAGSRNRVHMPHTNIHMIIPARNVAAMVRANTGQHSKIDAPMTASYTPGRGSSLFRMTRTPGTWRTTTNVLLSLARHVVPSTGYCMRESPSAMGTNVDSPNASHVPHVSLIMPPRRSLRRRPDPLSKGDSLTTVGMNSSHLQVAERNTGRKK